ncbi:MAG TPA: type II toxin-antitoxin system prevent-host-death family antitoxin [Methylomirabilota bacterium]|nr:type II toxin-antitoxin system prevent-host-death family antitoxin [Methylomirabilota bacterium]
MQKVGSREFKNRLGRYLRAVRRGETLVITDRGTPVAKVTPADDRPGAQADIWARLEELEAQGLIRLGRGPLTPFRPVKSKGKPASQMIIEDRR